MSSPHPEDRPETPEVPAAPEPGVIGALLARDHAASLQTVARERVWLLEALRNGEDIEDLARLLNVTPRAIRHLLGDAVGRRDLGSDDLGRDTA
ncbi:hypothetical protein GCM10009547_08490 [Sporichthya brevicatena]|uniref:Uncharacterized protein n=1 Tax=Sporichthya brevicatena TaxID=171442 RepID=A0ABN1GCX5_9ACTN